MLKSLCRLPSNARSSSFPAMAHLLAPRLDGSFLVKLSFESSRPSTSSLSLSLPCVRHGRGTARETILEQAVYQACLEQRRLSQRLAYVTERFETLEECTARREELLKAQGHFDSVLAQHDRAPQPSDHVLTVLKAGESVFQTRLLTKTVVHAYRGAQPLFHALFWRQNTV